MKKIFLLLLLIVAVWTVPVEAQATRWNINQKPNANWWSGAAGKDTGWEWMKDVDTLIAGGMGALVDTGATIYYVDNNAGSDTNDGLSWDHAFLTISTGLAASHANIATSPNFANRNRIYVKGDDFDEDWTDLAQKTDMIGVGSDDGNKGPRILGNHVIDATASGANYNGMRFINMTFLNQTAADVFVVPTGHHALEWIFCRFESNSSTLAPSAIDITACNDTKIIGCDFISSVNMLWASGAIDLGAGLSQNTHILGNYIDAAIGITIDSGTTGRSCRIAGNTIHSTTLTIDDNADIFHITDNTLISDGVVEGATDFNLALSANNAVTGSDGSVILPMASLPDLSNRPNASFWCSSLTSEMTTADYGTADDPTIFTVTGAILCRANAVIVSDCTSASTNGSLELGVAANTALLLIQDVVDGTAFKEGDTWTMTTGPETDITLALPTEWYFIGGGADILLNIATNDMASGTIRFNLEWYAMSPDADVVAAAP